MTPPRARCSLLLLERDLISEGERDPLRLGSDPDVAAHLAVGPLLDAAVDERVLAEDGLGVEVGREEARLALERRGRREALHVGRLDDVVEELLDVVDVGVDRHLVLPLELGPHGAEGEVGARGGRDVVHDVDVDVVEHHAVAVGVLLLGAVGIVAVVDDRAEDDARLRARDLDVGLDVLALARQEHVRLRPLAQLEVAHDGELEAEVVHHLVGLVDEQHLEQDVVRVHGHVGLGVDRVREAGELRHALEARREVLLHPRARGLRHAVVVLVLLERDGVELGAAAAQLAHDEQVVRLPRHLDRALLLGRLRRLGRLPLREHRGEGLAALREADVLHLRAAVGEQVQEGRDALLRVGVHRLLRRAGLAQLQHPRQQQHHVRGHLVGDGGGHVLARAQRELGERRRHHGRQEEVAAHEHRAQLGRARVGRGAAVLERRLRRVAAVGEHHRAALRLGHHRRARRVALAAAAHKRQLAEALLEHREGRGHLLGGDAVLTEQPEGDAAHARGLDGGEGLQQLRHDDVAQLRVGLDDLAHEEHDVHRGGLVGVAHKVHEHRHHGARRVGELDRRAVDGRDEHGPVLGVLLAVLALRLLHLLLEHLHDLADVVGHDERERDVERLLADVQVGAAQAADDVHDHALQHLRVLLAQVLQPLEHDELDVVVRLRREQLRVRGRRRLDRRLRGRERDQRRGALVDHGGRLRVEERQYASDVL
mmetsp:Transcript_20455/g.48485  ORF Transcript_20455/g.48485 Transcript_20455/m.48485 type:complete len:711 (-) Transcript_20455:783-2915(-)